jgi:carbamoylphosphate synthase large subunit
VAGGRLDALVLDLDTRAGLAIARSLGRQGLSVGLATRDPYASGMRSKHGRFRVALPAPEASFEAYADAIVAAVRERPADAILPTIDSSVAALHARREALAAAGSAPAIGSVEAVELATSKSRTLELATTLGIPVPRSLRVESTAELEAALDELGLPAVLKPETSWRSLGDGGERVAPLLLETPEQARAAGDELLRPGAPGLLQELATGRRETIKLFRVDGRVTARLAMVVERAWPPLGGSSVMRATAPAAGDTLEHAERLVDAIGLDGYAEAEFRRDAAGRPLLMEVNARLSQSVELAVRAGVDFPRMQLEWARGGPVPEGPAYPVGLRVGWLAGDARLAVGAALGASPAPRPALAPTLAAIALDYSVRRSRIEGLDLRDPAPTLAALRSTAGAVRGRLTRAR